MRRLAPLFLLSLFLALPLVAHAEDKPLFDSSRLSASLGINYSWFHVPDSERAPIKEFEVGPYAAYSLLAKEYTDESGNEAYKPILSLSGSSVYGLDSHVLRTQLGLRLNLYSGGN